MPSLGPFCKDQLRNVGHDNACIRDVGTWVSRADSVTLGRERQYLSMGLEQVTTPHLPIEEIKALRDPRMPLEIGRGR